MPIVAAAAALASPVGAFKLAVKYNAAMQPVTTINVGSNSQPIDLLIDTTSGETSLFPRTNQTCKRSYDDENDSHCYDLEASSSKRICGDKVQCRPYMSRPEFTVNCTSYVEDFEHAAHTFENHLVNGVQFTTRSFEGTESFAIQDVSSSRADGRRQHEYEAPTRFKLDKIPARFVTNVTDFTEGIGGSLPLYHGVDGVFGIAERNASCRKKNKNIFT